MTQMVVRAQFPTVMHLIYTVFRLTCITFCSKRQYHQRERRDS